MSWGTCPFVYICVNEDLAGNKATLHEQAGLSRAGGIDSRQARGHHPAGHSMHRNRRVATSFAALTFFVLPSHLEAGAALQTEVESLNACRAPLAPPPPAKRRLQADALRSKGPGRVYSPLRDGMLRVVLDPQPPECPRHSRQSHRGARRSLHRTST